MTAKANEPRGLEAIYTLQDALEFLPFPSTGALRDWLWRHRAEYPGSYRRSRRRGGGSILLRVLTAPEVASIQAAMILVKPFVRGTH